MSDNVTTNVVIDESGLKFFKPLNDIKSARDFLNMRNGNMIFFGKGTRDDWCPYVLNCAQEKCAMPSDVYYFSIMRRLADMCGAEPLYLDIRHIFEHTTKTLSPAMVEHIAGMATKYGYFHCEDQVYRLFLFLYYGMVSEENFKNTRIGRCMKMFAVHRILRENIDAATVSQECRGRTCDEIIRECEKRMIYRFMET